MALRFCCPSPHGTWLSIGSARGSDGAGVIVAFGAVVGPVPVCVYERMFWDEALKAADCVSAVAEDARLIGFRWLA